MDATFDPKNFAKYKVLLNDLQTIENLINEYVTEVIEESYGTIVVMLSSYLQEIKEQNDLWSETYPQFIKYEKAQLKLIDNCIHAIDSHRYENDYLFSTFVELKKKLIDRKLIYKNIISFEENDLNYYDIALQNLKNNLKYYELKFINNKEIYLEKAYNILESKESSGLIKILYTIKKDIIKTDKNNFYNLYIKAVDDCKKNGKNNFYNLYFLINDEKKLFKNIKDSLAGLELSFFTFSDVDFKGLSIISDTIIELHNNCLNELNFTKPVDSTKLPQIEMLSLQKFEKIISQNNLTYVSESVSFDTFAKFASSVSNNLEKVRIDFTNLYFQFNCKEIYNETFKQITFGNQLYEMFLSINIYIDNVKNINGFENSTCNNIMNGINETISIKKNNLKEKINEFEILLKNKIIYINDDNYNEISKKIFANCLKNSELYKLEKIYDIINSEKINLDESEKIYEKEIVKIKKNCILYEISTFEEIVNHSVLVLRNSNTAEVVDFVEFMDMINMKIDRILAENKIIKILPVEHEIFNAKEHTVLVAEKNSAFCKGEIIKVIGAGYKDKKQVFIKANVVAAK